MLVSVKTWGLFTVTLTLRHTYKDFTYNNFTYNDFIYKDFSYNDFTYNVFTYSDLTYNDLTYNDFTYRINKCNITYMFYLLLKVKSFISKVVTK
jgi:hypothetical protein